MTTLAEFYHSMRKGYKPPPALVVYRAYYATHLAELAHKFPKISVSKTAATMLNPSPIVRAVLDTGEEISMSFYQPKGKPWDVPRARELIQQCLRADVAFGAATRVPRITELRVDWQGKPLPVAEIAKARDKMAEQANRAFLALEKMLPYLPPEAMKVRGALHALAMQ